MLTSGVQVYSEVLEDVHVRRVGDGAHAGREAFTVDVGDGLRANIQHQRVHHLYVIAVTWFVGHLWPQANEN